MKTLLGKKIEGQENLEEEDDDDDDYKVIKRSFLCFSFPA